ncbi:hypothetical protein OAK43_04110 [Verrucomicrobiales bacterium]|nr:hypothetical protein [Verrucomicrobiales bacterium]
MNPRLIKFLIIFTLVIGGFEVFARVNGKYFYALSDKVLLKAEIPERSPETKVLFIGSSRFLDAIDHTVFSEVIAERTGNEFKSLNGATTGFDGARFAYFAEIAADSPQLTHVILEASSPSLQDGKLDFPDQKSVPEVPENERKEVFADIFETHLQDWLTQNIALVKYRKSLRPKVLLKLLVLFTADSIDPNFWMRKGIARNLFGSSEFDVAEDFIDNFKPDVITPTTITESPENLNPNHIYGNLENLSTIFSKNRNLTVIWVAPPVSKEKRKGNYSEKFTGFYQDIAFRFGSTFYDYAGLGMDEEFLRDPTHLNAKGRALFSTILADQLAGHFTAATPNSAEAAAD